MAENLKDEMLSMEELDKVAGGTLKEISLDREFLRDIGFDIEWKNTDYIYNYFDKVSSELRSTWSQRPERKRHLPRNRYENGYEF